MHLSYGNGLAANVQFICELHWKTKCFWWIKGNCTVLLYQSFCGSIYNSTNGDDHKSRDIMNIIKKNILVWVSTSIDLIWNISHDTKLKMHSTPSFTASDYLFGIFKHFLVYSVALSVTTSAWKRCSFRLHLKLFVRSAHVLFTLFVCVCG